MLSKRNDIKSPVELLVLFTLNNRQLTRTDLMEELKNNFSTWEAKEGTIFPIIKRLSGEAGNRFTKSNALIQISESSSKSKEKILLTPKGEEFLDNNVDLLFKILDYNLELFFYCSKLYKNNKSYKMKFLNKFKYLVDEFSDLYEIKDNPEYNTFNALLMVLKEKMEEDIEKEKFVSVKIG